MQYLPGIIAERIAPLPTLPIEDIDRAVNFARLDKAESTRTAYRSDFRIFTSWCTSRGVCPLPAAAETVAGFLAAQAAAGLAASTVTRRGAAIRYAHKLAGLEPPGNSEAVKATLSGIRRTIGTAPKNRKAPLLSEAMHRISRAAALDLKGLRDRALLLLGFGGAFRRSELAALNVDDLEFTDDGLKVTIRRSKTDQEGVGVTIAIVKGGACCPCKAIMEWMKGARIESGPLFRAVRKGNKVQETRLTPKSVCVITKAYAALVGLDAKTIGAHSLRSGFLTSAARKGASVFKMRDVSRHKSMDVLQSYVRDADLFRDHAGAGLL
jgi:site-specific recombinase XerD